MRRKTIPGLASQESPEAALRLGTAAPALAEGAPAMAEPSLWDYVEEDRKRAEFREHEERDAVRRRAIKRLRASGHWLTLLRVARTIPQPFTLNDISVAVWKACPEFFGMKGYPYPDNHKVHYILYGDKGLIAKGLLHRVSQGLFRVPDGLDPAQLQPAEDEPEPAPE